MRRILDWFRGRDGDLRATRRAARTAVIMPALFAVGFYGFRDQNIATFAAFGSFALLLLADFGGPLADRLIAQTALIVVGCVFITLATLASANPWVAAAAMVVVGFVVLFAGVVSSAISAASTSVLLSFILPVTTKAPASVIPERLLGWLLAGAASLPAIALLWPAPRRDPLRNAAAEACRALSARLTADVTRWHGRGGPDVDAAVARAEAAVAALRKIFLATPYRPSGLTTAGRAVVRLVDEVVWLAVILDRSAAAVRRPSAIPTVLAVKKAAAVLLDHAGKALSLDEPPQDSLQDHLQDLARARRAMEAAVIDAVPLPPDDPEELIGLIDPSFRAQELSVAVMAIAANIEIAVAAEQRTWWQKLLGRRPRGLMSPLASAQERALAHAEVHSVWLRNSIRGAIALGGAVLVADLSGAQNSFWIVLGALSVLRSNALSTGENVVRGLVGTAVGFVIGGGIVSVLGTDPRVLWPLLPLAILVAGIAPAISFTAGQAGFTITLLILFNIISPAGWKVGLVRIEDVAIGCAVSLVVGVLFWPRGATGALRTAIAEAYAACAAFLRATAESGAGVDAASAVEEAEAQAAAAARRLDDAFREFLAERGRKRLSLSEVTSLLTGVAGLRLTAQAVRDLWSGDTTAPPRTGVETPRAQLELLVETERVTNWYAAMAQAVAGAGTVPRALTGDAGAARRLVEALARDLAEIHEQHDLQVRRQAVRLVWTSDHVDAARRVQELVETAARSAAATRNEADMPSWLRPGRGSDAGDGVLSRDSARGTREAVRG